jgi:glycine betaine/choline ABC-type transport system substrate-binding protein/small-conductance mechanosensitive channel
MSKKSRGLIISAITLVIIGGAIAFYMSRHRPPAPTSVLRAGFIHEFATREDGYPGLKKHYNLEFPFRPELFDPGLIYQQLIDHRVDVISGHSTAGIMGGDQLFALKDDKNLFPPYEAAPLVRRKTLTDHPELKDILRLLAGQISEERIRNLNYQVEVRGKRPVEVARDFLISTKLIDPGKGPGNGSGGTITIGAKNFPEQEIIAEMMAILIQHRSNVKVLRKLNLGGTALVFDALRREQIDLYVEYSGTGLDLFSLLNRAGIRDPDEAFYIVRRKFAVKYNLVWLERLGFNNTWSLFMRSQDALKLGIETISDLARVLREQSEDLAQRQRDVPVSLLEADIPTKSVEAPLTLEQRLRSLEHQLQPSLEFGRRSLEQEERYQAHYDLIYSEIKLDSVIKDLNAGPPPQILKAVKESKRDALTFRVKAEKLRVSVLEQTQVLKKHRQFMAETQATMTPDQEVHHAFRRVAMTEELVHSAEALTVTAKNAGNEYGRHLELLKEAMPGLRQAGASAEDLKALRDEIEQMPKEIKTLQQHAYTAARQLERLKKEMLLALDQLEVSEERFRAEPEPVKPARIARSLPASAPIDELRREAERRESEARRVEKRAKVFEGEAERARELAALKKWEKEDSEWELEFVRSELLRLKKEGASEDEIAAARGRIDSLKAIPAGHQKPLAQLSRLRLATELRAREKRLHADSVRRDADTAKARLRKEEARLRRENLYSSLVASIVAAFTIGLALLVRRLVRRQELSSLEGVTDPEKAKRIYTPYLLIRRIAVPFICIAGGLLVLMQFETFQRIGLTIFASAGIVSLVLGFAARNLLANAMAGITLCFSQPIRVGDTVKMEGEYGTIEDIGLLQTTLRVWDNRRVVIPNEVMASKEVINYSLRDERIWTKVPIQLDYSANVKKAREILIDVAKESKNWNGQEEPVVWFMELSEQSVTLWVAAWADDPGKAWGLYCDILDNALRRFQEEGIPVPRQRFQLDGSQVTFEPGKGFQPKEE